MSIIDAIYNKNTMVNYIQTRNNGDREFVLLSDEKVTMVKAICTLFQFELGYGGWISDLSETHVEVTTKVFQTIDKTVVRGTKEQMRPLIEICYLWIQLDKKIPIEKYVDMLPEEIIRTPLLCCNMGPILIGRSKIKAFFITVLGLEDHIDVILSQFDDLTDIYTLYELKQAGEDITQLL